MSRYDDIIDLPHYKSVRHPPMSRLSRAAQFGAFRALTGHDEAICETARLTAERLASDETAKAEIDRRLRILQDKTEEAPTFSVTYFVPDSKKEGGAYVTKTGVLRRIDTVNRLLILTDRSEINLDEIVAVEGAALFD